MTKHFPAPWHKLPGSGPTVMTTFKVCGQRPGRGVRTICTVQSTSPQYARANADLIEQAPAMAEAIHKLLMVADEYICEHDDTTWAKEIRQFARTTIAKAEGRATDGNE